MFRSRIKRATRLSLDEDVLVAKIRLDTRTTVRFGRLPMQYDDAIAESNIGLMTLRGRTLEPRVVAAGRDIQHATLRRHGPKGVVRSHEFEDFDGIESVSRANHAAAFDKISRSVSSCRMRLRSRAFSSWSALVKPSLRRPASRSARLIQLRTVWRASLNSSASSSAPRPDRASSTILSRKSAG